MISIPQAEIRGTQTRGTNFSHRLPIIGGNYDKKRKQEAWKIYNDPINPKGWLWNISGAELFLLFLMEILIAGGETAYSSC